ncbi:MAG: DUF285 domain-containing protein, partial [Ilumatobacteraceae bacterium]|nr:DUF285 domain-containing protein [Ilumatobacteraceae bacterium]
MRDRAERRSWSRIAVVCAIAGATVLTPLGGSFGATAVSAAATADDLVLTVTVSDGSSVALPIKSIQSAITVDWGDGSALESVSSNGQQHVYSTAGDYEIVVSGGSFSLFSSNNSDRTLFRWYTGLSQWGSYTPSDATEAFAYWKTNFTVPSDLPSTITDTSYMFQYASSFNGDLSTWDTSNVTNMSGMFQYASSFNGDLSTWDTSNVTNMSDMFQYASSFNGDISTWDTSNITSMNYMFQGASSFNGDLSTWDTSKVTNMGYMFQDASSFNSDHSTWDTSNITNMNYMLQAASSFNCHISTSDTSNITNMNGIIQ